MKLQTKFDALNEVLQNNHRFAILSHIHTDGDALGSTLALFHYLRNKGKEAHIFIPGEIPPKYDFLNTERYINRYDGKEAAEIIHRVDVVLILDISALKRLEPFYEPVMQAPAKRFCIDHHPIEENGFDLSIVDTSRVATAEILYAFFKHIDAEIDFSMAEALYTAILSDSGGFRFQHTDQFTFMMAAELVQLGVDPVLMYSRIFEAGHYRQIKAWGALLDRVQSRGTLAWVEVTQEFLQDKKISLEEIDGIIDILRKDRQASILAVFVEKEKDLVMVGLRSKNGVNVGAVAERFGGGGHYHAAGFTMMKPLEQVVRDTIHTLERHNIGGQG
ncbi:MAG TPA: hypothetical protein ENK44_09365 [Caldithrix abyssi]|uniref:Uncharacterized protein n=1 Tax=Caldithrix abyssi TaxID=187145 RepID=A0A7V4U2V7_CALAY|nr:hypothetical protein [Caldithrix abyssi]